MLDQVGVEDCYSLLITAVMHRYATGEDIPIDPISRDIKDALIKQNIVV
jgi:hypothetical protein